MKQKYYRVIIKQNITDKSIHVYWNEMKKAGSEELMSLTILDVNVPEEKTESYQILRRYNIPRRRLAEFIWSCVRFFDSRPIFFHS